VHPLGQTKTASTQIYTTPKRVDLGYFSTDMAKIKHGQLWILWLIAVCLVIFSRLRNDLYCVGWDVKLYSIQSSHLLQLTHYTKTYTYRFNGQFPGES